MRNRQFFRRDAGSDLTVCIDRSVRNQFELAVFGGCSGNLQGISRLIVGMTAQEAIERMRGIRCGMKPTSCPDQLSYALEKALKAE